MRDVGNLHGAVQVSLKKDADKVSLHAEHLKFKLRALWLSEDTCFCNGRQ